MSRPRSMQPILAFTASLALCLPALAQEKEYEKPALAGSPSDGFPTCWQACPQDPTHDGLINIDDLVMIITNWGVFGGASDVNGDGVTNINDLVIIITSWGTCPAPANDSCANATWLNSNSENWICTRYATTDGGPLNVCGFCCNDLQIHKDVWYTFSTSVFGGSYFTELGMCGSNFDTKIAVYRFPGATYNCSLAGATLVACNDDTGTWCNTSSRVRFALSASSTYLVRVGGYNNQSGVGYLRARTFVNGDECFNAIDLGQVTSTNPLVVSGNTFPTSEMTVGYLRPQAGCVGVPDGPDVWYKFQIGCGGNLLGSVYTCDDGTTFDTILEVFRLTTPECEAGGFTYVGGAVQFGCNDDYSQWDACLLNGLYRKSLVELPIQAQAGHYYIRLSGYGGATGQYRLRVGISCIN